MQMHFNVSHAQPDYLCDAIYHIGPVLFLRIEKGILRAPAVTIDGGIVCDARPSISPAAHSREGSLNRGSHAQWFEVIGDGDACTFRCVSLDRFANTVFKIGHQPDFRLPRKHHSISLSSSVARL